MVMPLGDLGVERGSAGAGGLQEVTVVIDRVGLIVCRGGPLDGLTVVVDAPGGVATRGTYYLARVDGVVFTADDPNAHDVVGGSRGWVLYRRVSAREHVGVPVYEAVARG
jgi:hypothetical protein